ncbi:MAG: GGDEF domain-containing protein [Pseudomonadota bacterium]
MEPNGDSQFRILGQIPAWFEDFVGKPSDDGTFVVLEELYHFAEGFIPLAESLWAEEHQGILKSGPWTETDSVENERHLELHAVNLNGRKILLLQLLGEEYKEKQNILQNCREQGLDYEVLFKTQQALNKAHDQLKRQAEQLKELALVDELTGLNNRRGFMTLAEQQIKMANRNKSALTLVYFDLDNFKTINDTLGHAAGDRVLVLAADLLRDTFRQSDILGRMGGDEFVALITDDDDLGQKSVRERLEENLKNFNSQSELNYA